jgi:putative protease
MNKQTFPIELLSPARTAESGIAAIRFGADAVYIGAPDFSARASAGNSLSDIEKLIEYAHTYRAKVYAAINTILKDEELETAQKLIQDLYNISIDGIIIQDMGLLEMDLPPVRLIASTQTNNTTAEKVKFLEDVGFKRVILARELSIDQIKDIRSKTTTELECFIHGAICVGYSGQCYMSYAIGGRSGNKGVCAQPCREMYSLSNAEGKTLKDNKYLLSLKDLCLQNHLEELVDAGVTSFKIEGRLKDDNYVKNITAFYRQKLDEIIENKGLTRASAGKSIFDFTPHPSKSFNRGFTEYFFNGIQKSISSIDSPKSRGEYIGKVISRDGAEILIDTKKELIPGDGICFFDTSGNLNGTFVNQSFTNRIKVQDSGKIKKGVEFYRNFDKEFSDRLERSKTDRKIRLDFTLEQDSNGIILTGVDEDGTSASILWADSGEKALNRDKFRETVIQNLSKLGSTIFYCENVTIKAKNLPFCPISTINNLRREITDKLEQERKNLYSKESFPFEANEIPYPSGSLDYRGNVLNAKAASFYQRHGVKRISPAAESGIKMNEKAIMKTRYCMKRELGLCAGVKPRQIVPLFLTDKRGNRFRVEFTCDDCGMEIYME